MSAPAEFLSPAEASRRLRVSPKALRLYEQRGLIKPLRTAAGWRAYGPEEMARTGEIVALRALGLSLAQIARVLDGEAHDLEPALATHQAALEERIGQLGQAVSRVRGLRADLARGKVFSAAELSERLEPAKRPVVAFDLPWPWGGERFELREILPLNYLTGPLGCGKTRLALRIAETVAGAVFLGLERAADGAAAARAKLADEPVLAHRVDQALTWLVEDGAERSDALLALLVGLEAEGAAVVVVDMVEHALGEATQAALIAYLRRRGPGGPALFLMTRSNVILDLGAVGPGEAIIYCPANHDPPIQVVPSAGSLGYEAVATCLASPAVRARTEGMRAVLPDGT